MLGPDDYLRMGTDLVKYPLCSEAAYDDARGVPLEFNATFCASSIASCRRFSIRDSTTSRCSTPHTKWIEMRLRAPAEHTTGSWLDLAFTSTSRGTAHEIIANHTSSPPRRGGGLEGYLSAAGLELAPGSPTRRLCSP